jgi:soluble lytic murein transglycosylase-like protein
MPRARTQTYDSQTAAAPQEQGSGCLSVYTLPPLAVILISCLLAAFAFRQPAPTPLRNSIVTFIPTAQPAALEPTPFYVLTPTPAGVPAVAEPASLLEVIFSPAGSDLAALFTPEVQHWRDSIVRWASAAGVDPNLAAVVMQIESCGHPRATSRSGAMGLFQVMPFHFQAFENPYDPDTNALRGLAYLARSLETAGGDARLALAGYNGGIGVIARSEWAWPAETTRYVHYGAPIYADAQAGLSTSVMLDEWYQKYGAGLCRQAREHQ